MSAVSLLRRSVRKAKRTFSSGSVQTTSGPTKYLGPDIHDSFMKPLEPVADYPSQPGEVSYAAFEAWQNSPKCGQIHQFFEEYPSNSLIGGLGREVLYHIVRTVKPEVVIEVGTYYA